MPTRWQGWLGRWGRPGLLTAMGIVAWIAGFVLWAVFNGIPYTTDDVCIWLVLALLAVSLGDLGRAGPRVLRDWAGLFAVLVAYNYLRGYATHTYWSPHEAPQVAIDRFLGGGETVTRRLQGWLFDYDHLHVWDYACALVYLSHFVVSFIVMAVLWKRNHARFVRYMASYLVLTFAGFVTFVLVPAQPPWMAAALNFTGTDVRVIPHALAEMHLPLASAVFLKGSAYDNEVASFPSLHAAYPLLLCLFFWGRARKPLRVLLVAYPLAMAFTLLYGAEHFVIDIVFGWLYASVAWWAVREVADWVEARRSPTLLVPPPPGACDPVLPSGVRPPLPMPAPLPARSGGDPFRALKGPRQRPTGSVGPGASDGAASKWYTRIVPPRMRTGQ